MLFLLTKCFHRLYDLSLGKSLFKKKIISGCAGSSLLCMGIVQLQRVGATVHSGGWSSHCSGFSCGTCALGARTSVVTALGLNSGGHRFSCSVACGVFLDQGSNPCYLHRQVDSYPLYHQGIPFLKFYLFIWLHQVLVAAHGIFNLHFSLWGYL